MFFLENYFNLWFEFPIFLDIFFEDIYLFKSEINNLMSFGIFDFLK